MNLQEKDFSDLQEATDNYRNSCRDLDLALKVERDANHLYNLKIIEVSKKYWTDLQMDKITTAKYNAIIKFETQDEKLILETAKLTRKISENRNDSLREALYSLKKTLNF